LSWARVVLEQEFSIDGLQRKRFYEVSDRIISDKLHYTGKEGKYNQSPSKQAGNRERWYNICRPTKAGQSYAQLRIPSVEPLRRIANNPKRRNTRDIDATDFNSSPSGNPTASHRLTDIHRTICLF
jgi:hypothetical protein